MRTEKRSAFLSGLCGVAVTLGMIATGAQGAVSTERGASILAFPKVLANSDDTDTIIQITNISNNMVHARCFYVNASKDPATGKPLWQVTDFTIWLTTQQPTHWEVGTGRFVDPTDSCIKYGEIVPSTYCADAGLDPGAVPPVPDDFVGELKCVEVDVADNPIGGNHLKGEATIKIDGDVAKYNAIGIQGTDLAGSTGNELQLNQPLGSTDMPIGEYDACPNALLLNHFTDGVTDPFILAEGAGGTCVVEKYPPDAIGSSAQGQPCQSDADCPYGFCKNGPVILDASGQVALRSATLTDLTLIPCTEDFENSLPSSVTVQFDIYNEFEQHLSASKTVTCWASFYLFQVDSPKNPEMSVFSFAVQGTTVAHTRITPADGDGGVLGVAVTTRANNEPELARVALNLHMEGDRFTGTNGEVVDVVTLPDN